MTAPAVAAPPLVAKSDDLTIAEKEARIWDMLVEKGREATIGGDETKWTRGELAETAIQTFAVNENGEHDPSKERGILKRFATEIGMIDNAHQLYEMRRMFNFYGVHRAQYKDCTWSAMREASRHKNTLEQALKVLDEHGHKPVAAIRRAILGKPDTVTKTETFELYWTGREFYVQDLAAFRAALGHAGAEHKAVATVTWHDAPPAP